MMPVPEVRCVCLLHRLLLLLPGVLLSLVGMESAPGSSEDLATKCRRALKSVVAKLTALPALDALVHQALPEGIMRMVLEQVRPRSASLSLPVWQLVVR
jgi:hypothetical protein